MDAVELGHLIDLHAAALELFARQWCDDPADVVQAAFVRLIEQQDPPERPVAWLFQVVRNAALMQRRTEGRRRRHETRAGEWEPSWFEPAIGDGLDGAAATEALQEIDEDLREIVIARIWGSLTFEEIADVTGTSSSAAHRRYVEGVEQLRKKLGVSCEND